MPFSASCNIRQLASDDVAAMEGMLTTFGEAFEEVETYGAARPGSAYLRRLLASDYFIAIAALKGDSVVGGIAAYELPKFEQERSEIYIAVLRWILESARGVLQFLFADGEFPFMASKRRPR